MPTIILQTAKLQNLKQLKELATKMGIQYDVFTKAQEEDYQLGKAMQKSKSSGKGNTDQFLKIIGLQ